MSEKLDFSGKYCDYNDDFESIGPANDYEAAKEILRACTGLTLEEALSRLQGGATELYPSTWPTDTEVARECLEHMKADPRVVEPDKESARGDMGDTLRALKPATEPVYLFKEGSKEHAEWDGTPSPRPNEAKPATEPVVKNLGPGVVCPDCDAFISIPSAPVEKGMVSVVHKLVEAVRVAKETGLYPFTSSPRVVGAIEELCALAQGEGKDD